MCSWQICSSADFLFLIKGICWRFNPFKNLGTATSACLWSTMKALLLHMWVSTVMDVNLAVGWGHIYCDTFNSQQHFSIPLVLHFGEHFRKPSVALSQFVFERVEWSRSLPPLTHTHTHIYTFYNSKWFLSRDGGAWAIRAFDYSEKLVFCLYLMNEHNAHTDYQWALPNALCCM